MRSRVGEKSCGDKSLKNSFKIMESHRYNFKFIMQPKVQMGVLRFSWMRH